MDAAHTKSIMTVALMAANADGLRDDRERAALKQVADALDPASSLDLPALYRDVLLTRPELAQVVVPLDTPELRQYAYEMAVCVANADGAQGPAEADFLARLAQALQVPDAAADRVTAEASAVADAAVPPSPGSTASAAVPPPVAGTVLGKANVSDAELDQMIKKASVTNAALELLPESLASMAIIPLQMRLVYRIAEAYGYHLNSSHAKDFIATLGVGLTSQYVEQFGRKLLGGLLGTIGGGLGRAIGRQTASSGMTFATTYALGRVAQRYYAGGRTLDTAALKQTFSSLLDEARGMAPQYQSQIEHAARTIDPRKLVDLVKSV